MAGTFPNLSSGTVAKYPVVRSLIFPVKRVRFLDDTEQSWRTAPAINRWTLAYTKLSYADVTTLKTFFATQKGSFDSTWSFSIDGATWTSMKFEDDRFSSQETGPNRHSVNLNISQTMKSGSYASGSISVFPTINGGVQVQYPFTTNDDFLTTKVTMDTGLQFAWYNRTATLNSWPLRFPVVTNSEAVALFDFYAKALGPQTYFSFTDPNTAVTHTRVRFGLQPIQRTYTGPTTSEVTLLLEETA